MLRHIFSVSILCSEDIPSKEEYASQFRALLIHFLSVSMYSMLWHPNDSIIVNGQNTEKSPGVLRKLAVTQTPVKDRQLKLM